MHSWIHFTVTSIWVCWIVCRASTTTIGRLKSDIPTTVDGYMVANSSLSRNLLLALLLIAGGALFLCIFMNIPLELPLLALAGLGGLLYVGAKYPEWFLVAALFAPQWKTFYILRTLDKAVDLTIAMLLCLVAALIWRLLFQLGRSNSWDFRTIFLGQGNQVLAFLLFAAIVSASYVYTSAPNYGGSKLSRFLVIGS